MGPLAFGTFSFEYMQNYENSAYIISALIEMFNLFTLCKLLTFLLIKYLSIYHISAIMDLQEIELKTILKLIEL